ncbi:hypothetical protein ADK90_03115 [Streptomyces sp. XY413]|nr:hypothetical protein ADK90_03115 [Streptomyces sp. XY413]
MRPGAPARLTRVDLAEPALGYSTQDSAALTGLSPGKVCFLERYATQGMPSSGHRWQACLPWMLRGRGTGRGTVTRQRIPAVWQSGYAEEHDPFELRSAPWQTTPLLAGTVDCLP